MDEFPDPDEEFELMHADEFELLDEFENNYPPCNVSLTKAKRSLDFSKNPPTESEPNLKETSNDPLKNNENSSPSSPLKPLPKTPASNENSKARTPFFEKNESNKRTVDELFGNIEDIEIEELMCATKRSKTEVVVSEAERQEMMISKILAERKRLQAIKLRSFSNDLNDLTQRCNNTVAMSRKIPKYPFFPITTKKGLRLYTRLHSDEYIKNKADSFAAASNSALYLTNSFSAILDSAKSLLERKWDKRESHIENSETRASAKKFLKEKTSELWVEKYKPKSYLELLSDEGTNRIVLQWLKLWDKVVFNRENKIFRKENKVNKPENKFVKKNFPMVDEELDENNCPKMKIALLCGPPGLGKTTLAHLLARHAGYNSVEVNASDDRSPEMFLNKLETTTQMQAVMGKTPRPNCLILDEIDGAPAASINVLIKFAAGKSGSKAKGKKKAEQKQVLKRPIICICNNIYAPALRPLRQVAFVVHFPETSAARLAQRLVEIARKERVITDLGAMMALSQKTNNDIRSCLSTLYCYKNEPVKLSLIQRMNIGQKDTQKGLFNVWQDIFQIMRPQSGSYLSANTANEVSGTTAQKSCDSSQKSRMRHVLHSVQGGGDYEKLAQGVFENFLTMNLKDSYMKNVSEGLDWFCLFDELSQVIYSSQAFVLLPYLPYCFVVWHFLFSSYSFAKLTYPNVNYEMSVKASRTVQLIEDIMKGIPAYIRACICRKPLQLDILPLLNVVINPNLRPVNIHLYSKREKEDLNKVVNTMIDYNLSFIQERCPDGNFIWRIDPDINEVVKFEGWQQDVFVLNYSTKQLLSRELEMERVRRLEVSSSMHRKQQTPCRQKVEKSTTPNTPKSGSGAIPNHLQKLTPIAVKKTFVDVPTKDFFGRIIRESEGEVGKTEKKIDEIVKSDIWFHYKEGYNNAVRRPVSIEELT